MSDATNYDPTEALDDPALSMETVTNDAVAGETVLENGHYAGATGSEGLEIAPEEAPNDLAGEAIDLDTEG